MEEALKALNVVPRILARRSNALWDILLANEKEAKKLARSILTTKTVRMQTGDSQNPSDDPWSTS